MPTVSIIIPVYNAQTTVARTLRSLLEQTHTDWEAILIDDGSTDDSPGILADFAWRDDRFRIIRQSNAGLAAARNTGLDHVTGEFVQFLDADDWLLPKALEQLTLAAQWTGLDAACGPWELCKNNTELLGITMPVPAPRVNLSHLLEGNRLAPHSHIIRAHRLEGLRFDTSLRVCEDYDYWLRLASKGLRWATTEEPVACYRIRPGSLSKNPRLMLETLMRVLGKVHTDRKSLAKAARSSALFYATSTALADAGRSFASARTMLRSVLPSPAAFSAQELGEAAYWSLVFGYGIGPDQLGSSAPRWLGQLFAWWDALGTTSLADEDLVHLARTAVPAQKIAHAMLAELKPDQPAILAGALGANGREIVRCAQRLGIDLIKRDARLPDPPITEPLTPNSTVLVAPLKDAAILDAFNDTALLVHLAH